MASQLPWRPAPPCRRRGSYGRRPARSQLNHATACRLPQLFRFGQRDLAIGRAMNDDDRRAYAPCDVHHVELARAVEDGREKEDGGNLRPPRRDNQHHHPGVAMPTNGDRASVQPWLGLHVIEHIFQVVGVSGDCCATQVTSTLTRAVGEIEPHGCDAGSGQGRGDRRR